MSKFNTKDMELLSEAYTLRLLKEQAPSMTLEQVNQRLQYMTESEAKYIITVCDRITEAFSGLGSIGRAIGGAARGIGSGLRGIGRGAIEAGKEFKDNATDIYKTGEGVKTQKDAALQARKAVGDLIELMKQAKSGDLVDWQGDIMDLPLSQIITDLDGALKDRTGHRQDALDKGLFGGGGKAFVRGFNAKPKPKAAPVSSGPPPLPTTP